MENLFFIVLGALVSCIFAILQSHYSEIRTFQAELFVIRDKLDDVTREDAARVLQVYKDSLPAVANAVNRVRPYLFAFQKREIIRLLSEYREAVTSRESGLNPSMKDYPNNPLDIFEDFPKARKYLISVVDRMINCVW